MSKLSIIIPSRNEGNNVVELTMRIQTALQACDISYDIWFIDDSIDNTPHILADLSARFPEVHFYHRENCQGLASAVLKGFSISDGDIIIVMDADLQHPPEILPEIVANLQRQADIVIPSRFFLSGSDGGLTIWRKTVSWVARKIAQLALKKLSGLSDCTSGIFGLQRKVIAGRQLDDTSWKILIEILIKGQYTIIKEIPYQFVARDAGTSKMTLREQYNYLRHLIKLSRYRASN